MTKRSLIFTKGGLQTLDYFTDRLCLAADAAGYERTVADLSAPLGGQHFAGLLETGKPCAVIMFNNVGLTMSVGEENIWERFRVPVINMLVDHPRTFHRYLLQPQKNMHVLCVDRNHVRFVERFYPGVRASFMPHGGNGPETRLPYGERPLDVLYVGDCQQEAQLYHIGFLPDQGASFYRFVLPALLQEDALTCEEVIRRYMEQQGMGDDLETERRLNEEYAGICERYARRKHKKQLMEALSAAGISVSVYGSNWEEDGTRYGENIRLHGRVSAAECMEEMGRAKIVWNAMPWFRDGTHERVYNAMLSGAVAVTDDSVYLRETLTDGEQVVFYDHNNPAGFVKRIQELLSDEKEAERIAENGYRHALEQDTWGARLEAMLRLPDE